MWRELLPDGWSAQISVGPDSFFFFSLWLISMLVWRLPIVLTWTVTELMKRQCMGLCLQHRLERAIVYLILCAQNLQLCAQNISYLLAQDSGAYNSISMGGALVLLFLMRPLLQTLLYLVTLAASVQRWEHRQAPRRCRKVSVCGVIVFSEVHHCVLPACM